MIEALGRRYQLAVAGLGAAGGGIAIVPALGTVASLATASAEAVAALNAAVLYTLAVAEVHRLHVDDVERRRVLVLGVVMGEGGAALIRKVKSGGRAAYSTRSGGEGSGGGFETASLPFYRASRHFISQRDLRAD